MTTAEMQAEFRDAVLSTMEELGFDAQTLKACLFTAAGLEFERVLLAKLDPEVVQYLGHSPLFEVTVQWTATLSWLDTRAAMMSLWRCYWRGPKVKERRTK